MARIRGVSLLRGKEHVDTTLLIEHAAGHCESREQFRSVLDDESRGVFQGKIVVQAARAEDRRQDDDARAAAVGRGGSRQQAGTGNLRRRRGLRPRRHHVGAQRNAQILSDVARHSGQGGRGAADPGLHRRDDRGNRARRHPRGADVCRRCDGWGRGDDHASGGQQRLLRRRQNPRGFSGAGDAGLWQAAGLSRQRRLGAEAESRARPHAQGLYRAIRQCASRPALSRQRGDRGLRGRARDRAALHQCRAQGRDHLHPQRHRGDQSGRLYVRARAHQAGRRNRALDHGAPFQHRALAFPARAPGRGDQMGADRRRGQFPHRRIREAARRRAPRWWRSRRCRTRSAPWCR